jgi:hypothetical protein
VVTSEGLRKPLKDEETSQRRGNLSETRKLAREAKILEKWWKIEN